VEIRILARQASRFGRSVGGRAVAQHGAAVFADEAARRYGRGRCARPSSTRMSSTSERIEHARPDWIPATVLLREIRGARLSRRISS